MSKTITVTEMHRSFADYINQVTYKRRSFSLTKGNRTVAEIRPIVKGMTGAEFLEFWANAPHLDPEDAEQFAKDVEQARAEANSLPIRDPWQD